MIFGQTLHARYHETDTWMNRNGEWQIIAGQVLRYYEDPAPGQPDLAKYHDYTGEYELSKGVDLTVSIENEHLYCQKGSKPKQELIPEAGGIFFEKGVEGRQLFRRAQDGKINAVIERRNNEDVVWKRLK